jgi:hypothetical protein
MAERSDSLELRIGFHNAVSRFQDWTTGVTEPRVKYCGRFCAISEVCQEVGNLSDRLPGDLLAILLSMNTKRARKAFKKSINANKPGPRWGRHLGGLFLEPSDASYVRFTPKSRHAMQQTAA